MLPKEVLPCLIFPGGQLNETLDGLKAEARLDLRHVGDVEAAPDLRRHRSVIGNARADLVATSEPDVMQVREGGGKHALRAAVADAEQSRKLLDRVIELVPHELRAEHAIGGGAFLK